MGIRSVGHGDQIQHIGDMKRSASILYGDHLVPYEAAVGVWLAPGLDGRAR
jgi:hypothetical protein